MSYMHASRIVATNDNRNVDQLRLQAAMARLQTNMESQRQAVEGFREVMGELRSAVDDLQADMNTYRGSLGKLRVKTTNLGKTIRAFPA